MLRLRPIKTDEKIAVAIPTKNRPSYLAVLLTSLLNQTYTNFMIVINDQSNLPVARDDALTDLFALAKNIGHEIKIIRTEGGWKRHQQAMEAVPKPIEFILRIDDDMLPDASFIENVLKPFRFFTDRPLAAVGGCYPDPKMKPVNLEVKLTERSCASTFDELTWKLQGYHYYNDPEVIEVESLLGGAICYRRGAVEEAGGWAVEGYSDQAYREESDLCARLVEKNYTLMVTTEALAWHLLAPGGGARKYLKTPRGNLLISAQSGSESDDSLFNERMKAILEKKAPAMGEPKRYKISDLEKNVCNGSPLRTLKGRTLKVIESKVLRKFRGLYWYFTK
jgi:GT2 family glycosyltransferase